MEPLNELIEKLRALYADPSIKAKDLAIMECKAWKAAAEEYRTKGEKVPRREDWFKNVVNVPDACAPHTRLSFLSHGTWVDPLWELVDEGVSVRTAYRLVIQACKLVKRGMDKESAIKAVLTDYKGENTYVAKSANGNIFYRAKPKAKAPDSVKNWVPNGNSTREFKALLLEATDKYVKSKLPEAERSIYNDLVSEFIAEVQVSFENLMYRIKKVRDADAEPLIPVSYGELKRSCEVLGVAPPKRGASVDYEGAKNKYRKLAAQYHPDKVGTDPKLAEMYNAINEAWRVLQKHKEQMDD